MHVCVSMHKYVYKLVYEKNVLYHGYECEI